MQETSRTKIWLLRRPWEGSSIARFNSPSIQYFDNSGDVLDGGKLQFLATGTSDDLSVFFDVNLSIVRTNPVILDSAGRTGNIFLQAQAYKVKLFDKDDVLIFESDPVGADVAEGAFSPWNSLTIYNEPDLVVGLDGRFYQSITDGNQGNNPILPSLSDWMAVEFVSLWNANFSFFDDQIVKGSDGLLYSSTIASNLNNDPTTDPVNWQPAAAGVVPPAVLAAGYTFANRNF